MKLIIFSGATERWDIGIEGEWARHQFVTTVSVELGGER
jgi:hypothetical protein